LDAVVWFLCGLAAAVVLRWGYRRLEAGMLRWLGL
jgi:hypothetical protein